MIEYLKDQYYWWNVYNKLKSFLSSYDEKKILLFGYPKSGNTWLRFLLFNYLNLLLDKNYYKNLKNVFSQCNLNIKKVISKSFVDGVSLIEKNSKLETFFKIEIDLNNTQVIFHL